jgi:hypothetical protein
MPGTGQQDAAIIDERGLDLGAAEVDGERERAWHGTSLGARHPLAGCSCEQDHPRVLPMRVALPTLERMRKEA